MPLAPHCFERWGSRRTSEDHGDTQVEQIWAVEHTNDEQVARRLVADTTAPIYYDWVNGRTLIRNRMETEKVGRQYWQSLVSYSLPDKNDPERSTLTFDTTGGTAHVTQSRGTRKYGDSPPDLKGAIGVTRDSVEGVDIVVPSLKFTETHHVPMSMVTTGWINTLANLTGCTNNTVWRNYPVDAVLFLGASGQSSSAPMMPVTFSFEVGINANSLTVGGVSGVEKKAWEYIWAYYEDHDDTGVQRALRMPKWIFVERVYSSSGFGSIGI